MPGSPSTLEKEEARRAVTAGLTDGQTARTLQDARDSSKKKERTNQGRKGTKGTERTRRKGGCK